MGRPRTEAAEYQPVTIRLPKPMMDHFKAQAALARRSLNAELLVFIENCLRHEDARVGDHQPTYVTP